MTKYKRIAQFESLENRSLLAVVAYGPSELVVPAHDTAPSSMLSADFDADGDIDLVSETSGGVLYFQNVSGNGDFEIRRDLEISGADQAIDYDADGDVDLVEFQQSTTFVHLNDGTGEFSESLQFDFPASDVVDLNGDGHLDLVSLEVRSVSRQSRLSWLSGNDGPQDELVFFWPESRFTMESATLADMDSDGDLDLVRVSSDPFAGVNLGSFVENTGTDFVDRGVFFEIPVKLVDNLLFLARDISEPADLDGDGDVDLILTESNSNSRAVLITNDWANINPSAPALIDSPNSIDLPNGSLESMSIVDFDQDDDPDLIAQVHNRIYLLNNFEGNFGSGQFLAELDSSGQLAFADIDGNGMLDVAAASPRSDSVTWYRSTGNDYVPTRLVDGVFENIRSTHPLDFDGDGNLDLVVLHAKGVTVVRNAGNGQFETSRIVESRSVNDIDVIEAQRNSPPSIAYIGDTATVVLTHSVDGEEVTSQIVGEGGERVQLSPGMSGDGFDIITARRKEIIVHQQNGANSWAPAMQVFVTDGRISTFDVGDLDHDGTTNIVVATVDADDDFRGETIQLLVLSSTGEGLFDEASVLRSWRSEDTLSSGLRSVEIGDVNSDGLNDILWTGEPYRIGPFRGGAMVAWIDYGSDSDTDRFLDDGTDPRGLRSQLTVATQIIDIDLDGTNEVIHSGSLLSNIYISRGADEYSRIRFSDNPAFGDYDKDGDLDHFSAISNLLRFRENETSRFDFDESGQISPDDIDHFWKSVRLGVEDLRYDTNGNGQVEEGDVAWLHRTYINRSEADVNLDGVFNSSDLVKIFQAAKYETGEEATWTEGDWDNDGDFDSSDLVRGFSLSVYSTD